jgi:hypothetical protein
LLSANRGAQVIFLPAIGELRSAFFLANRVTQVSFFSSQQRSSGRLSLQPIEELSSTFFPSNGEAPLSYSFKPIDELRSAFLPANRGTQASFSFQQIEKLPPSIPYFEPIEELRSASFQPIEELRSAFF